MEKEDGLVWLSAPLRCELSDVINKVLRRSFKVAVASLLCLVAIMSDAPHQCFAARGSRLAAQERRTIRR